MRMILAAFALCTASVVVAAELDVGNLEAPVLSGELAPAAAIAAYCEGETSDMTQDAFCACPDDALHLLEDRLKAFLADAS